MLTVTRKHQSGISLIELMIAMVVGFIIVGGALFLGNTSMKASRDNIRMSFLNQELRNVISLVSRDIRRASYWGGSLDLPRVNSVTTLTFSAAGPINTTGVSVTQTFKSTDIDSNSTDAEAIVDKLGNASVGGTLVYMENGIAYKATITAYDAGTNTYTVTILGDGTNPFPNSVLAANGGADKSTWTIIGPAPAITISGNCATFSYDQNGDGVVSTSSPDERIGYRLDATDNAVEARQAGSGCGGSGWLNITDENTVNITNFTITDRSPSPVTGSALTVSVREYTIYIRGQLRSDSSIVREVRETIRVRNNEIS